MNLVSLCKRKFEIIVSRPPVSLNSDVGLHREKIKARPGTEALAHSLAHPETKDKMSGRGKGKAAGKKSVSRSSKAGLQVRAQPAWHEQELKHILKA